MEFKSITVTTAILGMRPYILIEADKDPDDGELILKVDAGGGAEDDHAALPYLLIANMPADKNPITAVIGELLDDHPGDQDAMIRLAELLGVPMPVSCEGLPNGQRQTTSYEVTDGPKMLRETLCIAQTRIGNSGLDEHRQAADIARLGRLIDECDRHRPLGADGKHGDRHTPTCGCEDR